MTMREDECKMVIRAIAISIQHEIDLKYLSKEFYEINGHPIPFKKFGYTTLENYLKSIPDVVSIHGTGNLARISVVCTEQNAHVRDMVVKQKPAKKKKRFSFMPPVVHRNYNFYSQPNLRFQQVNHKLTVQTNENHLVVTNGVPEEVYNWEDEESEVFEEDCIDHLVKEKQPDSPTTSMDSEDLQLNYKIPNDIQLRLKELIEDHPGGIWCADLPLLYRNKYKEVLAYGKYGYVSIIQMCSLLPTIFKYKQINQGDYKLFKFNQVEEKENDNELLEQIKDFNMLDEQGIIVKPVVDFLNKDLHEVVELGSTIKCIQLPESDDEYIDIVITEVFDPSKFWFSLVEQEQQINDCIKGLDAFCKSHLDMYLLPESDFKVGMYCAVKYRNEFHRAKIISLASVNDTVQIFYIDYGTFLWVPKEQICYLHKDFAKMPAQALRGCLANIQPVNKNTRWDYKATQYFLQMIMGRKLVAKIQEEQEHYFELIIADTNGAADIYINDSLVLNGYALFNHQEQVSTILSLHEVPNVTNIHLYPTFDDLESGQYPNFMELCTILNAGVSNSSIFKKYYRPRQLKEELIQEFTNFVISH